MPTKKPKKEKQTTRTKKTEQNSRLTTKQKTQILLGLLGSAVLGGVGHKVWSEPGQYRE